MPKLKYLRGFTLIELLVVIAIIAILASLVLSTAGFIQKKAARSRAEAEIQALSAALESYKADNGDYPIGKNGDPTTLGLPTDNKTTLVTNLMNMSAGSKIYFEFSKNMTNAQGAVVDPFGEPYGYYYDGTNGGLKNGKGFYDLWSRGGTTSNSNQIIGNW